MTASYRHSYPSPEIAAQHPFDELDLHRRFADEFDLHRRFADELDLHRRFADELDTVSSSKVDG